MFEFLKPRNSLRLAQVDLHAIRSHTKELIRSANKAEIAGSVELAPRDGRTRMTKEWLEMTSGEAQLAKSIGAAVSSEVNIHAIVDDVIWPLLDEAVVVSQSAHDAITRAIRSTGTD